MRLTDTRERLRKWKAQKKRKKSLQQKRTKQLPSQNPNLKTTMFLMMVATGPSIATPVHTKTVAGKVLNNRLIKARAKLEPFFLP